MQGLRLRRRGRGISAEESRAMLEFYKHTYLCCGWRGMRSSYNGIYYPPEMQQGDEFEWDSHNEDKLAARHGVDRYEAEEAAADPGAIVKRAGRDRYGNRRYVYVG
jgi:hypothetical protein